MKKLLHFEFHRISRQKSFYVCFGISLLLLVLNAFLMNSIQAASAEYGFDATGFLTSALSSASFVMLLGIFTALYACDDNSNNTLKNIYARGYSRGSVYLAKYLASALTSLLMAVVCMALSFVLCLALGKTELSLGGLIGNLLSQLVMMLGYHALYFAVAMFLGKVGGSVAFNLVGPSLVLTVLTLVTSLLKIDSVSFGNYWLDSTLSRLSAGSMDASVCGKAVVMAVLYIVVFISGGFILNRKKEV